MIRSAALAVAGVAGFAVPARAVLLDDLLARGYSVAASTRVPGSFGGCVRQHRLVFADGSVFACARSEAQTAYEPRVYVLRRGGAPPSVVLAGSTVLAGQLLRLRLHDYPVPLRMDADPLRGQPALPAQAVQPLGAIPAIAAVPGRGGAQIDLPAKRGR